MTMKTRTTFENVKYEVARRFEAPEATVLFDYWTAKRQGRDVPDWNDFDLADIAAIAPSIMVKDAVGDGREWINRHFGEKLARILSVDAAGLMVGDYHHEDEVGEILDFYNDLAEKRLPFRTSGIAVVGGLTRLPYEGAYLPLTRGRERVESILSVAIVPLPDEETS